MEFRTYLNAMELASRDLGAYLEIIDERAPAMCSRRRRQVKKFRDRIFFQHMYLIEVVTVFRDMYEELEGALIIPKKR